MSVSGMLDKNDEKPIRAECPFRVMRLSAKEDIAGGVCRTVICEAGGGAVIDDAGAGLEGESFCAACDVPRTLAHSRSCLYLVPFRVFQGNGARSFYSCRWRLDFKPLHFPENIDWCRACRHCFRDRPKSW